MTSFKHQIIDTWRIHQRITLFFIEHIQDGAEAHHCGYALLTMKKVGFPIL